MIIGREEACEQCPAATTRPRRPYYPGPSGWGRPDGGFTTSEEVDDIDGDLVALGSAALACAWHVLEEVNTGSLCSAESDWDSCEVGK